MTDVTQITPGLENPGFPVFDPDPLLRNVLGIEPAGRPSSAAVQVGQRHVKKPGKRFGGAWPGTSSSVRSVLSVMRLNRPVAGCLGCQGIRHAPRRCAARARAPVP